MFKFIKKPSNKEVIPIAWVDTKALKIGHSTRVLPLENINAKPGSFEFLKKRRTSPILQINKAKNQFETVNTIYVLKSVPYLRFLATNKIPTLTETVSFQN